MIRRKGRQSRSRKIATVSSWQKAPLRIVIENYDSAKARGAKILGVLAGCGEMADSFHRTRSSPDGKAIIGCIRHALADAGLTPEDIDYINPHGTGTPENDKMECLGIIDRVRRTRQDNPRLLQQIHGRTYVLGGRSG